MPRRRAGELLAPDGTTLYPILSPGTTKPPGAVESGGCLFMSSRRRSWLRQWALAAWFVSQLLAAACGDASDDGTPTRDANEGGANAIGDAGRPDVGASTVLEAGASADGGATDARAARPTLSVLFIGNSYTYVNDV